MCTVDHLKAENLVIALGAAHRVGGRASRRSNPLSRPPEKLVSVTLRSSTAKSWSPWLASRRNPPATVRSAVERGALVDSPCAGVKPPSRAVDRTATRFHRNVATHAAAHWRSTAADREMSGAVYQHCEFVAEERAAIEAWGKWLTGLTADAAANDDALRAVVP
jgi:hypothetical protein